MKNPLKVGLLGLSVAISTAVNAETIDVAILYTQPAAEAVTDIDTKINQYIAYSNRVYRNNALDIQLRHVAKQNGAYSQRNMTPSEDDLNQITYANNVNQFRADVRADMVVLLGKGQRRGNGIVCGIGWIGFGADGVMSADARNKAYSVTAVDCGASTFLHELGHNMGLRHSAKQGDSSGGVYVDGVGHGVDFSFSTIMAYPHVFNTRNQLDVFSTPYWNGCEGQPCGVEGVSDAWKTLDAVKDDVANYY